MHFRAGWVVRGWAILPAVVVLTLPGSAAAAGPWVSGYYPGYEQASLLPAAIDSAGSPAKEHPCHAFIQPQGSAPL